MAFSQVDAPQSADNALAAAFRRLTLRASAHDRIDGAFNVADAAK